jgi:hypothetical protein
MMGMMVSFRDLDWERSLSFCGLRAIRLGDALFDDLMLESEEMGAWFDPRRWCLPVEPEFILEGEQTADFVGRVVASGWCGIFEKDLERVLTEQGSVLLSGVVAVEVFEECLDSFYNDDVVGEIVDSLLEVLREWKTVGIVSVRYQGFGGRE